METTYLGNNQKSLISLKNYKKVSNFEVNVAMFCKNLPTIYVKKVYKLNYM